jgi:NTP pyrophosphatase (non-canonical NTP hydrolase)
MNIAALTERAMTLRAQFGDHARRRGTSEWSREEIMQGFVVDVGDLMKLVMAKRGLRDVKDLDEQLRHELADCLWSVLVLAKSYDVDLEREFLRMTEQVSEKLRRA